MKKLFFLFIMSVLGVSAIAQDAKETKRTKKEERRMRISAIAKQEEEGVIKYKKHTVFGAKLTSDGYGGFIEVLRAQTVRRALLFQLDISERKHVREYKKQFESIVGYTSPIAYGKINFFYPVKLGVQQQYLLGNKGNKNGVSVNANIGGGFVAGLLRPYMIQVDKNGKEEYVQYDASDTAFTFLNYNYYIKGPGLGTGWNKLKFTPGLYLKAGLRFDFGKYNEMVNALEIGVSAEYYSKKIPQLAFNNQKQSFFAGYVALMFGKRK